MRVQWFAPLAVMLMLMVATPSWAQSREHRSGDRSAARQQMRHDDHRTHQRGHDQSLRRRMHDQRQSLRHRLHDQRQSLRHRLQDDRRSLWHRSDDHRHSLRHRQSLHRHLDRPGLQLHLRFGDRLDLRRHESVWPYYYSYRMPRYVQPHHPQLWHRPFHDRLQRDRFVPRFGHRYYYNPRHDVQHRQRDNWLEPEFRRQSDSGLQRRIEARERQRLERRD